MMNSSKPDRSSEDLADIKSETEEDGLRLSALRLARGGQQKEQSFQNNRCSDVSAFASSEIICLEPKTWVRVHKNV